jgi:hypothetical protein
MKGTTEFGELAMLGISSQSLVLVVPEDMLVMAVLLLLRP